MVLGPSRSVSLYNSEHAHAGQDRPSGSSAEDSGCVSSARDNDDRGHLLGLGSVSRDERERITLNRDNAGDQLCLRMSIQMFPLSLMFMW